MRTRIAALGTVAAVLALTACMYTGSGPMLTKDDLAGHVTEEDRAVDGFTAISMGGNADLTVTEGDEFAVVVTADENLQEHVITRVNGSTLEIKQAYSYFGTPPQVVVAVTLPALSKVSLSGSSDAAIRVTNPESLEVNVSGSADVNVRADATNLTLAVSGSGSIVASGTVSAATLSVSGSGEVDGANLTAREARVNVSGSGDASVRARETLDAQVSGSGHVTYFGDPTVAKGVSGSGSVERAEG